MSIIAWGLGTNSSVEHGKKGILEGVNVKTIMSGQQHISDNDLQSDERAEAASLVKATDNSLLGGDKPPTEEPPEPLELGASGMDQPLNEHLREVQMCHTDRRCTR